MDIMLQGVLQTTCSSWILFRIMVSNRQMLCLNIFFPTLFRKTGCRLFPFIYPAVTGMCNCNAHPCRECSGANLRMCVHARNCCVEALAMMTSKQLPILSMKKKYQEQACN